MIYKDGIFAIVDGKQRVLIPATSLCDFEYLEAPNTFAHKDGNIIIHDGDIVQIRVVHTMYNRKNLSCVGSLIT
jgi:DNA-directed RNA polymerase subunit E'/Rpb7